MKGVQMNNKIKYFKSIRTRLFLSLCIIVFAIIATLIMLNNFVLKQFYEYNKVKQLKDVYSAINYYYNKQDYESNLSEELDKIALKNNFNILITSNENISIYSSNKDFYSVIGDLAFSIIQGEKSKNNEIEKNEKYRITKFKDSKTNMNFIMFTGYLDNSYKLYIRMPVAAIEESVKISNEFLSIIAVFVIIIGGVTNCVLDYIFMKHLHMGIKGAAIATATGYMSTIIYAFYYYIIAKKSKYKIKFSGLNLKQIGIISFNGSSDMISNLAGAVTSIIMNHLAFKYYGEIGVSSLSVVFYFQFIMESIFMGFTSAVEPVFSYHYGSGDKDARKKVFKLSNIWIFVISIVIMIASYLLRNNIVDIFFDRGTEIYKITQLGFTISILATLFCGYNTFFSGLFTAFSNGLISGILSVVRTFVILVISLYLMSYLFEGIGLWSAWPVAEVVALIFSLVFVIKYKNRYNYI